MLRLCPAGGSAAERVLTGPVAGPKRGLSWRIHWVGIVPVRRAWRHDGRRRRSPRRRNRTPPEVCSTATGLSPAV